MVETLVRSGISVCFANPGTSEIHATVALERNSGMRPVLTLFEAVATGAADGYARMTGSPAAVLLHQGPGLANGLTNIHNATKARSPIVNIVGGHTRDHQLYDTPLKANIAGIAGTVCSWVREVKNPENMARDAAEAAAAANGPPGQVATLVVPSDCSWMEAGEPAGPLSACVRSDVSQDLVEAAAKALTCGEPAALFVGGTVLLDQSLALAGRIARSTGARLFGAGFFARLQRGAGRLNLERLPYFPEDAEAAVASLRQAVMVGCTEPVTFFAYPNSSGLVLAKECTRTVLAGPDANVAAALAALSDALETTDDLAVLDLPLPEEPTGNLTAEKAAAIIALNLPEGTIVSEEGITAGFECFNKTMGSAPHDWLFITGGGLGQGLTAATGAAIACPDRKVLCLHGDGGAMYTCQALWTQARENLDVTTVIFANRSYAILEVELQRLGLNHLSSELASLVSIDDPTLDFVKLAESMGVEAMRAKTAEEFRDQFCNCMKRDGPQLIEAIL